MNESSVPLHDSLLGPIRLEEDQRDGIPKEKLKHWSSSRICPFSEVLIHCITLQKKNKHSCVKKKKD